VLSVVALIANISKHAEGMRAGRLAVCIVICIGVYSVTVTDTYVNFIYSVVPFAEKICMSAILSW